MDIREYELLVSDRNSRRTKYMSLVNALLTAASGNASALEAMDMAFTVDNAAGEQLDILGDLVGVKRLLDYKPSVGDREMSDEEYRLCIRMAVARNEWDGTNEGAFSAYSVLANNDVNINYYDNQDQTVTLTVVDALSIRIYEILRNIGVLLVPVGISTEFEFSGATVNVTSGVGVAVTGIEQVAFARAVD